MKSVLVFADYYYPAVKAGGPVKSLRNFIEQMSPLFKFFVITRDIDIDGQKLNLCKIDNDDTNLNLDNNIRYCSGTLGIVIEIIKSLTCIKSDVVYINSLFSPLFSILPLLICKIVSPRKRVLIAPRGELSSGALKFSSIRKSLYLRVAKLIFSTDHVSFHATSETESSDIFNIFGARYEIFIVPNIVSASTSLNLAQSKIKNQNQLAIVYLSRITRKKNLKYLIDALSHVAYDEVRIELNIYGPIEDPKYWDECLTIMYKLPECVQCKYFGVVHPDTVEMIFSKHDIFILPTLGENFGHAIIESLCASTPVLISDTTPWSSLNPLPPAINYLTLDNIDLWTKRIVELAKLPDSEWQIMRYSALQFASKLKSKSFLTSYSSMIWKKR